MLLPTNAQCKAAIAELGTFTDQLSEWERSFVHSNKDRDAFTHGQKQVIHNMADKYELESYQP